MIRVTIEEFKQICNLNIEDKDDFIRSKFLIIDKLVQQATERGFYGFACGYDILNPTPSKEDGDLIISAFNNGFSYFLYAECIDFLNTDTLGDGIVKSTGYLDNRKEMIGFEEMEQRRNKLELKAYSILKNYLNADGLRRYNELRLWDDMLRSGGKALEMRGTAGSRVAVI